jgi:Kdo2-lipid IVA lauroyltransferase/acyltransferase
MFLFKLISFLPLSVLYIFTDLLYLIGYHVLKYRQKVILENLDHSFPEKTGSERKAIAKKFFRNLTDSFAETLKFFSMTPSEVADRFKVSNTELIKEKINKGEIVILVSGHFINWEGQVIAFKNLVEPRLETVYLRINNPFFDRLMQNIRKRFGGTLVEKADFSRNYLRNRKNPRAIGLGADQRPTHAETRYSAEFMNRKTAFFEGPEKLAKRYGHAVFYGHIRRPKRGHYTINYELIAAPPYDNSPEHSITDLFIEKTEKGIREQPEIYLWSHNRWK